MIYIQYVEQLTSINDIIKNKATFDDKDIDDIYNSRGKN